ncbi:beta-N-acetylhexosaminidase [Paenibacillaceae bacterium WGS1546]|uniref:beta-N-acetylhexosaminidase n=1 Tax=Cohnella sp. WGS1546 TaxID=3366810 RepID=UPI00372D1E5C
MKLRFEGELEELQPGISLLSRDLGIVTGEGGIPLRAERSAAADELEVARDAKGGLIRYGSKHQFFRGLGLFVHMARGSITFRHLEKQRFERVGPMLDLSRNAVLTVDGFKSMLNKLALMGMNAVMLYMEDTYEIADEPYFGYMRGRYSHAELREIDDYADLLGIEAFPSIQTLAHLEEFLKWQPVWHYRDTKGALLVGEERTDKLVENMIESASTPFRSRKIHLGMDEAEELGRGKYLDKNGYGSRFDIMAAQLDKALSVTRRLGLKPMIWSDMFLKLAVGNAGAESDYYAAGTRIPERMASRIPKDVDMVYWDYVHMEPEHYERVVANHRPLGCNLVFAGAVWVFNTFGVNYGLSLAATDAALTACKKEGIREVYATMWGDDGNESNPFAALLGLQFYAEHAYCEGTPKREWLAERVKLCTGIEAKAFLQFKDLDETPGSEPNNRIQSNPSKFLLYQDVLLGQFDKQIEDLDLNAHYAELESRIRGNRDPDAELDFLFDVPEKLSAVLKRKSEIGIELKRAYDRRDAETLRAAATETLPAIAAAVRELRAAHRAQWFRMFKPFGWEVLDIRYGGVVHRLESASARLLDYVEGRIAAIEELEQARLVFNASNRFNNKGVGWCSYYYRMASPNAFFHVINPF